MAMARKLDLTSLKWLSDYRRSLACDFSFVWDFWLCSRQYFRLLSCSRIILLDLINLLCLIWDSDSFRLIQTHSDSFRLIQTHSDSFSLIEPHWDSWRRIRRILRKRTLLARIAGMRLKSHFLKRCSLSERLKNSNSQFLIFFLLLLLIHKPKGSKQASTYQYVPIPAST